MVFYTAFFRKKMLFLLLRYKTTDYLYLFQHQRREQVSSLEPSADKKRRLRLRCFSVSFIAIVTHFFLH